MTDALENMPGGVLIYRADNDKEEILFANKSLISMFDCDSYEEFYSYVGGSFKGVVSQEDLEDIEQEITTQINSGNDYFDHIHYHILTKKGDIKYIEDFGQLVEDPEEGPLYYVFLIDSDQKMLTYDIDKVTGLPGGRRLRDYSHKMINIIGSKATFNNFVYIYINLVHFKRFNIRYGIKAGDNLLKDLAHILKRAFPNNMVARLSDTNFAIFTDSSNIEDRIKDLNQTVRDKYGYKDVLLKAGAYVIGEEDKHDLDTALDNARRACRELDYSEDVLYKIYDDEMKKSKRIYNYVVNHIDEAIEYGWIKAYYQPVVRTLSGSLCSAEALARWVDPQFGILSPIKVIGPLEDTRQIHKLDTYILNEICRLIRGRIDKGEPVIPISFNLSRLDFMLMDVYSVVIEATKKYQIPHSTLKIEITESTIIDDPEGMVEIINKLRREGFEIWMDDFGSGYSTLGTLKDYNFDEIKIDMAFIQDFSYRSKQIITHIISMSKSLGIKTLAEGVEAQEHFDFLKSIGCEKAQGYLFSQPLPFDEMIEVLKLRGIGIEPSRYNNFYDEISRIDFTGEIPMCIVAYNKQEQLFKVLFMNNHFKLVLRGVSIKKDSEVEEMLNSPSSLFGQKVRKASYLPLNVGERTTFFYTYLGHYIKFESRNIASLDEHLMFVVNISNLTTEAERREENKLETTIKHIYTIYDEVYSVDIPKNKGETIVNDKSSGVRLDISGKSFKDAVDVVLNNTYIEDRERLKEFMNPTTLVDRISGGNSGYITEPFRFYDEHRELYWKAVFVILISRPLDGKVLIITRRLTNSEEDRILKSFNISSSKEKVIIPEDIYKSTLLYSDIKFFWKDKDRRFLGCSQSFLDIYGLKSQDDIIGKTDEDMNWNVTIDGYRNDELRVIEDGEIIRSVPGVCIIKGVPCNIACTKWPIYHLGKIVGLFGYFIVLDDNKDVINAYEQGLMDKDTGVLNSRGFLDSLLRYINESRKFNVPFSAINIHIRNINEIEALQGKDVATNVEKAVAKALTAQYGIDTSISHVGFGRFIILRSFLNEAKSDSFCIKLAKYIEGVKMADGFPVTLFVDVVAVNSEEASNSPEGFNKLFMERFAEPVNK